MGLLSVMFRVACLGHVSLGHDLVMFFGVGFGHGSWRSSWACVLGLGFVTRLGVHVAWGCLLGLSCFSLLDLVMCLGVCPWSCSLGFVLAMFIGA